MIRRRIVPWIILVGVFFPTAACAEVFRYTDDSGRTHYVDKESKVPEQYKDQLEGAPPLPEINKVKSIAPAVSASSPSSPYNYRSDRVEIFVADWCPHCKNLEAFLKAKRIRYRRYDIEKSTRGRRLYEKLGGEGLPLVRIGSRLIRGFNPNAIIRALARK